MKTKKIGKKLQLNKATVSDLKNDELKKIKGGFTDTCIACETCTTCLNPCPL